MKFFAWLLAVVYFGLVLVFALNNTAGVSLLFSSKAEPVEVPLVVVIFGCFLAGIVLGLLALLPAVIRLKRQNHQLRRQARLSPAAQEAAAEKLGDQLTRAARNVGAVGIDVDTQFPRR